MRKSLNLGHTFGHAYESTLNYSKKLNHGEAVLYGIFSAAKFSKVFKFLNINDYELLISHLSKLGFVNLNKLFTKKNLNKIISFMIFDKKNYNNKINLITLKQIGKVNISNQFTSKEVKKFINSKLFK